MRSKQGKNTLTPVQDVIRSLMQKLNMPGDLDRKGKVFSAWEGIAGQASAHSTPFRFRGQTLIVEVASSTWMNELNMRKSELIRRIEREAGEGVVSDIRFQLKRDKKT